MALQSGCVHAFGIEVVLIMVTLQLYSLGIEVVPIVLVLTVALRILEPFTGKLLMKWCLCGSAVWMCARFWH